MNVIRYAVLQPIAHLWLIFYLYKYNKFMCYE